MGDAIRVGPDHRRLFEVASEQHGYFTAAQAGACGVGWDLLSDGARLGRYLRIRRGLYRLRDYPSTPREEVMMAWLAVGKESAVVSHESAMELLDLSDVIPTAIHLTVPRSRRHLPDLPGVTIHTSTRALEAGDVTLRDGMRVTSVARMIADVAETGTGPEQVKLAVGQALRRGQTTRRRLEVATADRSRRVRDLIAGAAT